MNFYGIGIDKLSNNKAAVTHSIPLTIIKLWKPWYVIDKIQHAIEKGNLECRVTKSWLKNVIYGVKVYLQTGFVLYVPNINLSPWVCHILWIQAYALCSVPQVT